MANATASVDIDRILNSGQLPALPQSAISLLQLSKDPNNGPAEFAVPIETDPGLTGQVLRFVNSSYFGFSREISSVKLAITLVGIRTIKNFALWSAVFSLMPNPKCGPFELKCLWQDSLRRAIFARAMSKALGSKETEEPFAAALLQDMAVPLLAKEFSDTYAQLLVERDGGKVRLSTLEKEKFGFTHCEVAARMARHWNLPEATAALIEQHSSIADLVANPDRDANQTAVALSSLLPATTDETWSECKLFNKYYAQLVPQGEAVENMLQRIDEEFADFAPVLKIAAPAKSLVEIYTTSIEGTGE